MSVFGGVFGVKPHVRRADTLHDHTVAAARRPALFGLNGAPDTIDGRFDMLVLHAALLARRISADGPRNAAMAQAYVDRVFRGLDDGLRLLGVGDAKIASKLRKMAEGFYGRAAAFTKGLEGTDDMLADAIRTNLFSTSEPNEATVARFVSFTRTTAAQLEATPMDALLQGEGWAAAE
jgi:cytochrome b pre-mRNA-processing protein 3